jgi:hypothetical protein
MNSVYFKSMFLFWSLFGTAYELATYNNEKDVSLTFRKETSQESVLQW